MAYTDLSSSAPFPPSSHLPNTTTRDEADIIPRTFFTNFQMTFHTDILPWHSNNVRDDSYNFTSVFNRWDEYQIVSSCRANIIILQGQLTVRRERRQTAVTVKDMYSDGTAETTGDRKGLFLRLFTLLYSFNV